MKTEIVPKEDVWRKRSEREEKKNVNQIGKQDSGNVEEYDRK